METTKLYVELLVIGLESFTGVSLTAASIIGIENIKKIVPCSENVLAIFPLLGTLYIFGIIFDRLADLIFQPIENYFRIKSGLKINSIMLLSFDENQFDFITYSRSRMRILRATIINSIFIMISSVFFISLNITENKVELLLFIIVFCLFASIISFISFIRLIKNTYIKAVVIETNLNKIKD